MKQWKFGLSLLFVATWGSVANAATVLGNWTTVDDKTGQKRAVVQLRETGGKLDGTIVKVYPQPGDQGVCTNCPGAFKDKPVQGLQFMWGLKSEGNGIWDNGQILDPKTGKIYKAKIRLAGNKLYVRGYIGVAALGRTQVWVR